jgi:glutathione synthase/RimK-type ligase-like ATP-grasp enzyme
VAAVRTGIIGPRRDAQVTKVAARLEERGAAPVVLDFSRFPTSTRLSLRDGRPADAGLDLDVAAVGAWYVRSLPLPLPFLAADPAEYAAGRERRSFAAAFLSALRRSGAVFVNPPDAMAQHFRKLEQLDALRDAGVPVPATLATNDPDSVVAFAKEHEGAVVYKPLAGGALCRRLHPGDLEPDRLDLLARSPVLFQEEVPGADIRAYVVGGSVVAGYEIGSDAVDYRGAKTTVVPTNLTGAERLACLRAASACGMALAGIDVRRRADGTFAVLECNPSPMFAAIERRTGADPVTEAITTLLMAGGRRA